MRLLLLALVLASACGPDKSDSATASDTTEATAGDPTTGDQPTGDATTGAVDPGEFGEMEACVIDQVCETFLHPFAEGSPYHSDDVDGFLDVEKCILGGLRDATPGRYRYGIDDEFGNGHSTDTYLIHVQADRSVTFAVHRVSDIFDGTEVHSESYDPAMTCTLAPADYFATCLADHDDDTHYDCMDVEAWWSACAAKGPTCG